MIISNVIIPYRFFRHFATKKLSNLYKHEKRWNLFQFSENQRSVLFADLSKLLNERSFLSLPKFHEQWARFAMLEARIRMFLDLEVPTCKRILYRLHLSPNRRKHLKFQKYQKYFSIFPFNKNFSKRIDKIFIIFVVKLQNFQVIVFSFTVLSRSKFGKIFIVTI